MNSSNGTILPTTRQTVFVCGSLHLDVVVNAPRLPTLDETVTGSSVDYIFGGKGGNQAIAATRNGASTAFAGCVGGDEFGIRLTEHLEKNNIDCTGLSTTSGASGMSAAIVDSNGDYGAVIVSGSNLCIDSNVIEFPASTGILLLQNEIPESVNVDLARKASALNLPVMLNAAPYRELPDTLKSLIDILVLNRVEAEQFFKKTYADKQDVISNLTQIDSTIKNIIVTLGSDGLIYRDDKGQVHDKSAYTVQVTSSHGAGDVFCGALASRIVAGEISSEALDYAMAAAAWHVSTAPEHRSALSESIVQNFLDEQIIK